MGSEKFISNEELVEMVKQKNDEAFKLLLSRFDKFIFFKCRCCNIYGLNLDISDLVQECEIALYKAALGFNPEYGFLFGTYYKSAVDTLLRKIIKDALKKRVRYQTRDNIDGNHCIWNKIKTEHIEESPERYMMRQESARHLQEKIDNCLSYLEKTCLILYVKGLSYSEIAKKMGIPTKRVDNALCRVRHKLAKYLDIEEVLEVLRRWNGK